MNPTVINKRDYLPTLGPGGPSSPDGPGSPGSPWAVPDWIRDSMTWSEPLVLTETYHITFGTRLSSGSWCTTSTLDTKKSIKVTKIERNVKYYIQELRKSYCRNRLRLSLNWLKGKFLNHTFQTDVLMMVDTIMHFKSATDVSEQSN